MDNSGKPGPKSETRRGRKQREGFRSRSAAELLGAAVIYFVLLMVCQPFDGLEQYTEKPLLDPAGILQVYPWLNFNARELSIGHFPLWNPYTALGQPHLANIQTGVFFPLYWPFFAAGQTETAHGLFLLMRLWLSGILLFYWARKKILKFPGALIAGAAYAFGGYGLWFMQLIDLNSQMMLLLLLFALPSIALKPTLKTFIFGAGLIALAILGGHPEAAFITVFVAVLYTACAFMVEGKGKPLLPPIILLGAAGALGLMFALAAVLPFLNYLPRCWSMHGPGFGFFHLDPRAIANLLVPGVHAVFKDMPAEIPVSLINAGPAAMLKAGYQATAVPGNLPPAGFPILLLAAVAVIRGRKLPWPVLFFAGLFAVLTGLTLGLPGFRLIALVPPFNLNSNFKFFFSEIHVCLALLAGAGLDHAATVLGRWKGQFKIAALAAALTPALVGMAVLLPVHLDLQEKIMHSLGPSGLEGGLAQVDLNLIVLWLTSISAVGLVLFRARKRLLSLLMLAGTMLALVAQSGTVRPFIDFGPPQSDESMGDLRKILQKTAGPEGRVQVDYQSLPPNRLLLWGLKDLRSSDALFYKPYMNLINRVNGQSEEESIAFFYPSYFTRVSSERIFHSGEAPDLGARVLITDTEFLPDSIIDRALIEGRWIGFAKPWKSYRASTGHGHFLPAGATESARRGSQFFSALYLHAPSRLDFDPAPQAKPERNGRDLAFVIAPAGSDGIAYLALAGGAKPRLGLARFLGDLDAPMGYKHTEVPVELAMKPGETASLVALPGPRGDNRDDYAPFMALSFTTPPMQIPPALPMTDLPGYVKLYELPGKPWAHGEDDQQPAATRRLGNDKVVVDLAAVAGESLAVHEAWYPGWRAEVDGELVKIEAGEDKVSWRVAAPAGARTATFTFAPEDFRVGLWNALTAALFSLIMLTGRAAGKFGKRSAKDQAR